MSREIAKPRVAFVVQRYGKGINGGAERHCQMIVSHLSTSASITVLTSCAINGNNWENYYSDGYTNDGSITIRRFAVQIKRIAAAGRAVRTLTRLPFARGLLEPTLPFLDGPYIPGLVQHLKFHRNEYEAVVFFCYNFYPTQVGIHCVAERALLVPTAHDVPRLRETAAVKTLTAPQMIFANTLEEVELIRDVISKDFQRMPPIKVIGCGIDPLPATDIQAVHGPFVLILGRMKRGFERICTIISRFIALYGNRVFIDDAGLPFMGRELQWVIAGHESRLTRNDKILQLGVVPEDVKLSLLRHALVVINPSLEESLSLVLLEAWMATRPTIASGQCPVLRGQSERSNGGLCYTTLEESATILARLLQNPVERQNRGNSANRWVQDTYRWSDIVGKYISNINELSNLRRNRDSETFAAQGL